jgi:hypothetical protein
MDSQLRRGAWVLAGAVLLMSVMGVQSLFMTVSYGVAAAAGFVSRFSLVASSLISPFLSSSGLIALAILGARAFSQQVLRVPAPGAGLSQASSPHASLKLVVIIIIIIINQSLFPRCAPGACGVGNDTCGAP